MTDVATLIQFLWEGDFLGFIQACYVAAFQSPDLFYGMLSLIVFSAIYIRTKSLLVPSILWILLGSFFISAMPIVSGLAMLLLITGVAGLFFKLYIATRG